VGSNSLFCFRPWGAHGGRARAPDPLDSFAPRAMGPVLSWRILPMTILVDVAALLLAATDTNEVSDPSQGFIDGDGI